MIFWGTEPENDQSKKKEVVLAVQAKRQEAFLEAQLGEECIFSSVGSVTEAKELAVKKNRIDLLIVLRKSQYGGVDQPVEIATEVLKLHPNCEVLLIIGAEDEIGLNMLKEGEKLGARLLSSSDKPISADEISAVLANVKKSWNRNPVKIFSVNSAKGGSGATSVTLGLAAVQKEKTLILDSKGGIGTFFDKNTEHSDREDEIISVGIDMDYLKVRKLTVSMTENICTKYETVFVDEVEIEEGIEYQSIIVVDPVAESIKNSKKITKDNSLVVLNSDISAVIPKEVIEHELGKSIFHVIKHDRELYLRAAATMQPVPLKEFWEKL